ncbi:MAG: PTS transporter subunit IIC [Desulfurococcaceae archaeon]
MSFIATQIFGNPGIFYTIVGIIGLLLLRAPGERIISSAMKIYIGFFILVAGANLLMNVITPIREWSISMLGVEGVIPQNWIIFSKAMTDYGTLVGIVGILGFIINLILAKATPLKGIYLTAHINLIWASYFVGVAAYYKFNPFEVVLLASIAHGLYLWLHSSLTLKLVSLKPECSERVTNEWTSGTGEAFGIITTAFLSKRLGRKEPSTESIKFPEKLAWLRDPMLATALFATFIFLIIGFLAGPDAVSKFSGGTNWVIYLLLCGLQFGGSLAVLLYGVRMLVAELVPAFRGIAEKLIPGAYAGLDYPTFFTFAPTAVFIGFISNLIGGVIATLVMAALRLPYVILPAIWMNFWTGF